MVRFIFIFLILLTTSSFAGLQYLEKQIVTKTSFEVVSNNFILDTTTTSSLDDAIDENVAIGFDFPFNGQTYTQLNIDSNGHISFNNIGSAYTNNTLPDANRGASIFPYWDDLNPANGGTIKYGTLGNDSNKHFIVSWDSIPHYPSDGSYSFQLVLYADGTIRFRYDSSSDVLGSSATIGVQENTTNYDQHSYNSSSTFDASKDILYESLLPKLTGVTPSCTTPNSQIKMTTYDTTGYNTYPNNTSEFSILIQNYATDANLFGSGYLNQINGSGNPYGSDEDYLSIFEGYIYLPTTGVYQFGLDGDDAIEVFIDDTLITGWYGGHGRANSAQNIVSVFAETGWHKLKYHHQERGGGDNYYLYWQKPNGNLEIVPSSQLFHCASTTSMSIEKSSCVLDDFINSTSTAKRVPGALIRYAVEVKNGGAVSAENVRVNDTVSSEFDETTILNLQVQEGVCDCLGVSSASNNGINGTADGVTPIILDYGSIVANASKCGYFEVKVK